MASTKLTPNHRTSIRQKGVGGLTEGGAAGTPSPSWKEALKRGCLDRARRRRRDAVLRLRARGGRPGCPGTPSDGVPGSTTAAATNDDARNLVEEELRAKGVSVVGGTGAEVPPPPIAPNLASPAACLGGGHHDHIPAGYSNPLPATGGSARPGDGAAQPLFPTPAVVDGFDHAISMDEMYSLMKEVEEELHREELRLVEELQAMEQQRIMENQQMEEQIAHFEQWQCSLAGGTSHESATGAVQTSQHVPADGGDGQVPCPECNAAYLIRTPANVILCPNATATQSTNAPTGRGPSMRCNLRLDVTSEGLTLSHLREQVCRACGEHGGTGCTGSLQFRTSAQFGVTTLVAGCETCQASAIIL